ncbi:TonB-dependent receptor [Pseudomonas aeruginosa]|nr:TonB-dependent receptor [Pseudomonas aeruginosa]
MKKHSTARRVLALGLNLTLAGVPALLWADEEPTELPALTVSAGAAGETPPALDLDDSAGGGSRLGLSLRETPGSVSVANRASFERRGLRSTQDIANSLPGVNASAPPGFGGFVTYRGFSSNQVNQLFNGIPVQYSSAMRPLDDWIVDRVELVGGPSSFLNGAGAVGGSLDYISKLADRYGDFMEGRVRYGSYDDSEVAFGFNQALGIGPEPKHFVRLDVSRSGGNGYVDRNSRESWNVAFSLLSDLTPDLSHTLALEYQDEQEDSPYWGTPVLNPYAGELKIDKSRRHENYNVADGRYEQRVRWLRSILEYRVSDSTRWRNTFYHYDAERDYRNLETYRYNADNSGVVRSNAFLQRHDQQLNGNRFELQHSQPLFGLASDWVLGFDYSINKQTRFPSTASGPFGTVDPASFEPGHFYDLPGMRPGHRKDRSNEVRTSALFAENRLGLTDELSLVTGLRYDHLDLDVRNHRTVTASDPAHFERRWDVLTGRAGLVYQFTPHANVYLQYSTAADPPGGVLTSARFDQVRDYDLSTGDQWELGSKFDFLDGRGSATLAAYRIVRRDFSVADPNNPNLSVPVGQQTSRGIEAAASLRITPKLLAEGNFAWVDAQYDEFTENVGGVAVSRKGKTPPNVPERVGNLWLTYDFDPAWQGGVDARYVSSVYANNANTWHVPSYTVYGTFLSYRLDERTRITGRVRNLTDEVYARFVQSTPLYYVGDPRTFELSVQTRF